MISLLEAFKPHAELMTRQQCTLLKSGTLNDVSNYAGYFTDGTRLDPFVIMLNQQGSSRDRVLQRLRELYAEQQGGR
jgi:D-alanyl-D-alanine carboxypeptidase